MKSKRWIFLGLIVGVLAFILFVIAFPTLVGEKIEPRNYYVGIPLWLTTGFIFAYLIRKKK